MAKRSTDAGVTWNYMDINAAGSTVFNVPSLPPNNKRYVRVIFVANPMMQPCCGTPKESYCYNLLQTQRWDMPAVSVLPCRPVRYWTCSSKVAEVCYAATTGGLDRTADKGMCPL